MPSRIAVVVSQAYAASGAALQMEEDLISRLMFEPGIDASVIPALEHVSEGSTGLLCLEGIKGSFILLTWMDKSDARSFLQARNIQGRFGQTRLNSDPLEVSAAVLATGRTIYLLQLDTAHPIDTYLDEIARIRDESALRVINIDSLSTNSAPTEIVPAASEGQLERKLTHEDVARSTDALVDRSEPPMSDDEPKTPDSDDDLDRLLDELDGLDL
jgi:hypothetical protein